MGNPALANKICGICGIYKITNIINNKIYIGQSVNCKNRFRQHIKKLNKQKHNNPILQNAWNKYGENSFTFEIILLCNPQDLNDCERNFIYNKKSYYVYGNGYNCNDGGNATYGIHHPCYGRKRTLEEIEKTKNTIRNNGGPINKGKRGLYSHSTYIKQKISNMLKGKKAHNKGKPISEKTKEKRRVYNKNRIITDEFREKMSKISKGRKMPKSHVEKIILRCSKAVMQYSLDNKFIKEYFSAKEAVKELNLPQRGNCNISCCCKNKTRHAYGFIWKFKTNKGGQNE